MLWMSIWGAWVKICEWEGNKITQNEGTSGKWVPREKRSVFVGMVFVEFSSACNDFRVSWSTRFCYGDGCVIYWCKTCNCFIGAAPLHGELLTSLTVDSTVASLAFTVVAFQLIVASCTILTWTASTFIDICKTWNNQAIISCRVTSNGCVLHFRVEQKWNIDSQIVPGKNNRENQQENT